MLPLSPGGPVWQEKLSAWRPREHLLLEAGLHHHQVTCRILPEAGLHVRGARAAPGKGGGPHLPSASLKGASVHGRLRGPDPVLIPQTEPQGQWYRRQTRPFGLTRQGGLRRDKGGD